MALTAWATFVQVCRSGSLSGAAAILGYTQSGVSRQVAALEREIGAPLLTREARGVRVTPAGAALLPHARLVVAEAERARRAATTAGGRGHVALGAVPSAAVALVPAALRRMPDPPSWTMLTDLTTPLVGHVTAGELDLAVVTDASPDLRRTSAVTLHRLFEDRMAVLLPSDHSLATRRRVGITELADERWIEDNPGSEALLHRLAARAEIVLDVDRSSCDLMTKVALVAAGHGVALVPRLLAPALRPDVGVVDVTGAPRRTLYAAMAPGRDDLASLVAALRAAAPGGRPLPR